MTSFKKGIFQAAALAGATLFGVQMASAADLVTPPAGVKHTLASKFKYACDNKRPTIYVATKAKYTEQQWHRLLDAVVAGKYEIIGEIHNAKNQLSGLKLVKPFKYDNCEVKDHGSSHSTVGAKGETKGRNNGGQQSGGQTGGNTGGQTGGQTGGNTGGNTGGQTGGNTGGNTGGQTGGNTGGNTGGQTGGNTGGQTGGNDCGDGGKGQHGQQGGGKGQQNGGNHGNGGHNGGGHNGGRHAMLEQGVSGVTVATLAPVTTFKIG